MRAESWSVGGVLFQTDIFISPVLETRAFRALSMSGLGKMKEAVKEIKAVLMKNMMNYTCWHIMGIIHRKEK